MIRGRASRRGGGGIQYDSLSVESVAKFRSQGSQNPLTHDSLCVASMARHHSHSPRHYLNIDQVHLIGARACTWQQLLKAVHLQAKMQA